jgi:hypothetical protein
MRSCQTCLFCRDLDHPVFISLDFTTLYFLQSKVIIPASNPSPGGPGLCTYFPFTWQGGRVIIQGTRLPFHHLLWLTGLQRRYSNLPPHEFFLCSLTEMSTAIMSGHLKSFSTVSFYSAMYILHRTSCLWSEFYTISTLTRNGNAYHKKQLLSRKSAAQWQWTKC